MNAQRVAEKLVIQRKAKGQYEMHLGIIQIEDSNLQIKQKKLKKLKITI